MSASTICRGQDERHSRKGETSLVLALLSVSDKTGLVPFASQLRELGYELLSTGGTAFSLRNAGLPVRDVSDLTGFPEMLDGRVKTLHPHVHAGLLARRDDPHHMAELEERGIKPIDLLVSNLYPFELSVTRPEIDDAAKVEQIDIGGPAMVRAGAKNFTSVIVVTDPVDYGLVLECLGEAKIDGEFRRDLAAKAFAHVATYDSLVAEFLRGPMSTGFPDELAIGLRRERILRYGENPQQGAAAYRRLTAGNGEISVLDATQHAGPELSFNNLLDADAAWRAVHIAADPTVSIVKHTVPCGLATRAVLLEAFDAALAGDRVSAFGGIVALNGDVDISLAHRLTDTRFDMVIASGFSADALTLMKRTRNIRILELPAADDSRAIPLAPYDLRPIVGGVLVQEQDDAEDDSSRWNVVSERKPTERELANMEYAWAAARLVKSNAIVLAADRAVLGVGAGQPNRLESVDIAVRKAGSRAKGAALASDAFFPFADGLERAIDAGVTAVVQPGGSVRDTEVIAAANRAGIVMMVTGVRHFRH